MRKQITDTEYRIPLLLTNGNLHSLTIFLNHNAVHGKGRGAPLVLADTAIIVGLKVCHVTFLINRIRL